MLYYVLPVVSACHSVEVYLTGEGDHGSGEIEDGEGVAWGQQRLDWGLKRLVEQREAETGEPAQHQAGHSEASPEERRKCPLLNFILWFDFLFLRFRESVTKTDFDLKE